MDYSNFSGVADCYSDFPHLFQFSQRDHSSVKVSLLGKYHFLTSCQIPFKLHLVCDSTPKHHSGDSLVGVSYSKLQYALMCPILDIKPTLPCWVRELCSSSHWTSKQVIKCVPLTVSLLVWIMVAAPSSPTVHWQ